MPPAAIPYCGAPPLPADVASAWNLDPILLAFLGIALVICWRSRSGTASHPLPLLAGGAVLLILFISPFCALGSALFSARSAHHLVLSAVAAPLIAKALSHGGRNLAIWTLCHGAVFWIWYLPSVYALTLVSDAAYWVMQVSLLWTATGLWRAVRHSSAPASIAALLATMMQMGLLGALLTFARSPLYAWHETTTQVWGLAPLEDQQLAGLIMWVIGGGFYLAAALWLAGRKLGDQRLLVA